MRSRVLVVVGAVLLLAGCGGDGPEPGSLPPVSVAPSPAGAATPAALTAAELEAAGRAYYEATGRAVQTADIAVYGQVVAQTCTCYERFRVRFAEWKAKGQHSTAEPTVIKVVDPRIDSPTSGRIGVVFSEAPSTLVDAKGGVVSRDSGTPPRQEELRLQRIDGRLLVVDIVDIGLVGG